MTPPLGTARIIQGDATHLPLPDESVHLVITSPPYFGLRSYQDGGQHYTGQLGDEPTPKEYVDNLITATQEMVRVLKPTGSIWVNLGDKYARPGGGTDRTTRTLTGAGRGTTARPATPGWAGAPEKSLIGIPWRYALRAIDDLGLILRAEIIWSKPNGLPESVTDRARRSHETWFHFTKQPRYYTAIDHIREGYAPGDQRRSTTGALRGINPSGQAGAVMAHTDANPLGKLPGSVWRVSNGVTLARTILDAVAAGALTAEEGERLWIATSSSYDTSTKQATAGTGPATATHAATARQQRANTAKTGHTASPTDYSSDPSQTGSPSTTSAATHHASDPSTSNPSPDARTSGEPTQSAPPADTDTPSLTPTSTSLPLASPTGSAVPAPSPASDAGESVWQVPTQPLSVPAELGIDHYAAFPVEFPRRIIQGWSPPGICTQCGQGRRPVATPTGRIVSSSGAALLGGEGERYGGRNDSHAPVRTATGWQMPKAERVLTGYACDCPTPTAPTTPSVVLDPFGGTGTTALAAKALGRTGITLDMSADYNRIATWRCNDPGQLASAMQVDKPPTQHDGQLDLLEGILG